MLHIAYGDSTAGSLRAAGLLGEVRVCRDVLCEGPIPARATPEEWGQVRSEYWAARGYAPADEDLDADNDLECCIAHDEVVLWFEHDLYDQLMLVRLLNGFASRALGRTRLSLICIDRFSGIPRFLGLGMLTPDQLATLFPHRKSINARQLQLGEATWSAFVSPTPLDLVDVLSRDTSALPFLAKALFRHLEEYPSVHNGLSRTESQILWSLAARGTVLGVDLWLSSQASEESYFTGDTTFAGVVEGLANAAVPAITLGPPRQKTHFALARLATMTQTARDVLACKQDWVALNGMNRWLGGVYLHGRQPRWRWDDFHRRLVS
jgi:hypothetical protein